MQKFVKTIDCGKGPVNLSHLRPLPVEFRITEMHHKADGAIDDSPSFAFVLWHPVERNIVGQISLNTLTECLNELGYTLHKKTSAPCVIK